MSYQGDRNRGAVMRRKGNDDGEELPELYSIVRGEVASIQSYGAFIKIQGFRKNGLVHKSQISRTMRVEDVSEILDVGDRVYCKVISLGEEDEKKISLSMKVVNQDDGGDLDPNLVQTKQEELRKKKGMYVPKPKIELGAVLNTVCRKCGTKGHLTQDCFHQPGDKTYDLIPDVDVSRPSQQPATNPEGHPSVKGHKAKKKKKKTTFKAKSKKRGLSGSSNSDSDEYTKRRKEKKHKNNKKRKESSSDSSSESDDSESLHSPRRKHKSQKKFTKQRKSDSSSDDSSSESNVDRNTELRHKSRKDSTQMVKRKPSLDDDDTRKHKISSKRNVHSTRSECQSSDSEEKRSEWNTGSRKDRRWKRMRSSSLSDSNDERRGRQKNERTDTTLDSVDDHSHPRRREHGRGHQHESEFIRDRFVDDHNDGISHDRNRERDKDRTKRRDGRDDEVERQGERYGERRVGGSSRDDSRYTDRHRDRTDSKRSDMDRERRHHRERGNTTTRSRYDQ